MTTSGGSIFDFIIFWVWIGVFFKGWFYVSENILTHKIFDDNPFYAFPFFVTYTALFYYLSYKILNAF
tara:strand:- start:526 stop:729 length:204 start_codon:yes stop_codon:yes gene_type:complete